MTGFAEPHKLSANTIATMEGRLARTRNSYYNLDVNFRAFFAEPFRLFLHARFESTRFFHPPTRSSFCTALATWQCVFLFVHKKRVAASRLWAGGGGSGIGEAT